MNISRTLLRMGSKLVVVGALHAVADGLPVVHLNKNAAQATDAGAFSTASYWGDGSLPPHPGADYVVADGYSIRIPNSPAATFDGHSLQIGEVGGAPGTLIVWGNSTSQEYSSDGGLILANGYCLDYRSGNKANTVSGRVVVTAPLTHPFVWQGSASLHATYSGVYFNAALASDADTALIFLDNGQPDWHVELKGSVADCKGRLSLQTSLGDWLDNSNAGTRLVVHPSAGAKIPGEVLLSKGTALYPADKTVDFTIGTLTMAEGSLLRVVGDSAGAHSVFRVSDAFNFPEKEGSVLLDVSGLYKNAQVLRTAIFCAPASSGFTEKTFRTAADDGATMFPHYVLECEDANDVRTLYLVTKVVDPCTAQGVCLNAPSKWASGVLPSEITADSHDFYDSYFWICTSDVTTDKSFYSTATLTLGNSATFELYNPKFTVSELRLMNGAKVYGSRQYSTADANITELAPTGLKTLRATVRTPWLKRESVNMVGAEGTYWLHDGVVTGNGTLYLHNPAGASNAYYELRGDNSGFGGAVKIGTDTEGTGKAVLVVNDSRNLGGPCRSYRADGLVFSTGAVLWPKQSMVLDEASRGVSVLADSSIRTDAGVSFTVNQRIDWRATLSKIGSGCLVLGGNVTTTASNTAKLLVAEGDLKVASSEALKDVALMFGEGSGLKVTVPATDEMLRTKGFLVTAVDIPRSGISCTFDVNEGALSAMQDRYMAICTVPIGAAEAVRGRIKLPQRIPGYSVAPDERTDAESGTVTFGVRFGKGLLVVFR